MGRKKEEAVVEGQAGAQPEGRTTSVMASQTLANMRKKWGSNIIQLASDERVRRKHSISSGIVALDWALGGGWPAGRVNTVYGDVSSAKTTCMLHAVSQAQKVCATCYFEKDKCSCDAFREHVCAYINVEGTWDDSWARRAGVNTNTLMYTQPEYAEQSLDILETLLRSGDVDLIVLDSLAFLTPKKEIEESVSTELVGVQPRLLGKGTRKLVAALSNAKNERGHFPTIFFTNQIRMKIGVMFGSPETKPGGKAPQFASTIECKMRGGEYKMDDDTGVPRHVQVHFKIDKNKADRARMEGDFKIMLSDTETKRKGDIYEEDTMIDLAQKFGILEGHGNSWTCLGEKYHGKSLVERRLLTDLPYKQTFRDALMKVLLAI